MRNFSLIKILVFNNFIIKDYLYNFYLNKIFLRKNVQYFKKSELIYSGYISTIVKSNLIIS